MPIRILIVEDNPGDVDLLHIFLEEADEHEYVIEAASSLQIAMRKLANSSFDLVLLDLGLPDSHGLETLRAVVKHHKRLPVIVLTGNQDDRLGLHAVKHGAQDYLLKGQFTPQVLTRVIQYALERNRLQQSIHASETQLRTILDALESQVLLLDREHTIIWPNARACKAAHLERNRMIGKKCHDLFHADTRIPINCPFEKLCASDEHIATESDIEAFGKTYHVTCTPLFDSNGNLDKIIHVATDITKTRQMQRELIQAHKMEAMGSLAGGIAHDFNNILSAVIGFTDLALRKSTENVELYEDLEHVYEAGLRARDLVKQILNFARRSDEELKPVRADLIAKEVTKFLKSTLPSSIEQVTAFNSTSYILANPVKIHQVFMNICTNAAHAMKDRGVLTIEIDDIVITEQEVPRTSKIAPGLHQRIKICDTGSGIPVEIRDKIFEPFFTTKDIYEGTGMGLTTVLGVIQECNGHMQVESEIGQGSCFTILLPVTREVETVDEDSKEPVQGGSDRILLIDDEAPICKIGGRILSHAGYNVVTETDSEAALQLFSQTPDAFDLVITDMTMPRLSGDQLAAEILKIRPGMPIMINTGFSRQISEEKLEQMGIQGFMAKPIEKQKMLMKVREILDKTRKNP